MSSFLIINSAALAVISLFYLYSIASYFKITVWVLQDRVSYYYPFEAYVISRDLDHLIIALSAMVWLAFAMSPTIRIRFAVLFSYGIITIMSALLSPGAFEIIALLAFPMIILLLTLNLWYSNKFLVSDRKLVINYIAIIGIGTGILAVILALGPLYFPPNTYLPIHNYAYEVFVIFSSLSPIFLILLILCVPFKIITNGILTTKFRIKNSMINNMLPSKVQVSPLTKILLLILFLGLSATMVIIPHHKAINLDNQDVGVDTHYYVEWVGMLLNTTNVGELIDQTFVIIQHGDRPLALFFFLMVANILPSENLSYVFDQVPIVLAPTLVLVVFFLTREITSNDVVSLFSAFITAVSFHTLVGIYAGAYSNWLALIIGYLSIIFLFRSLKKTDKLNTSLFFVLIVTLFFTHIYTWSIIIMIIVVYLLVLLKYSSYNRRNIILLLIVVLSSVLIDFTRMAVTGAYSGIGYDISPPFGSDLKLDLGQFTTRWYNLIDTTHNYYGSLFGNSIIYVLALYWIIRSRLKDVSTIFLVVFLSIGIIPLFFGNWSVQARVFYDIPFQIPAGIALANIYRKSNGMLLVLPILLWLLAMSIISVSNFHLSPS